MTAQLCEALCEFDPDEAFDLLERYSRRALHSRIQGGNIVWLLLLYSGANIVLLVAILFVMS